MDTITYAILKKKIEDASLDINIPSNLSDLSEDSIHRTVTDKEKEIWNGKSDFSGDFNDLINKPTYTADDIGADPKGSADAAEVNAKKYADDRFTELIGTSPENLDTIYELANAITENKGAVDAIELSITNKVDKIEGKNLSTNDLTNELKQAYDNAAVHANREHAPSNAQENTIESISINGVEQTINSKNVNIDLSLNTPYIIKKAEGTSLGLTDSYKSPIQGLKIFGKTTQQTTTGAQLLNINKDEYFYKATFPTVNFDISDGSIFTFPNGTDNLTSSNTRVIIYKLDVNEGKTYTITGINDGMSILATLSKYPKNAQSIDDREQILFTLINNNYTFIAEDKDYMIEFRTPFTSEGEISTNKTIITLMLNEGEVPFSWEPYTGGMKSPNPNYQQKIEGMWNSESKEIIVTSNLATINTSGINRNIGSVKKGVTYTLCFEQDTNTGFNLWVQGKKIDAAVYNSPGTNVTVQYTAQADGELYFNGFTSAANPHNFMLVIGEHDEFIDFIKPETQALNTLTSNSLFGIPVNSGGVYTDKNGQQWIADYRDWGRGLDIQMIGKVIFDKTSTWVKQVDSTYKYKRFITTISGSVADKIRTPLLCNKGHFNSISDDAYIVFNYNSKIYFNVGIDSNIETVEQFMDEIIGDDGMEVYYILANPIETPIPTEDLVAFNSLHTYYPTTIIYNNEDCWMELKYVADTEKYIAQNYVPKNTYITLEQRVATLEHQIITS